MVSVSSSRHPDHNPLKKNLWMAAHRSTVFPGSARISDINVVLNGVIFRPHFASTLKIQEFLRNISPFSITHRTMLSSSGMQDGRTGSVSTCCSGTAPVSVILMVAYAGDRTSWRGLSGRGHPALARIIVSMPCRRIYA
jgi:hypothetical protein